VIGRKVKQLRPVVVLLIRGVFMNFNGEQLPADEKMDKQLGSLYGRAKNKPGTYYAGT
jgi:hypothetical protein